MVDSSYIGLSQNDFRFLNTNWPEFHADSFFPTRPDPNIQIHKPKPTDFSNRVMRIKLKSDPSFTPTWKGWLTVKTLSIHFYYGCVWMRGPIFFKSIGYMTSIAAQFDSSVTHFDGAWHAPIWSIYIPEAEALAKENERWGSDFGIFFLEHGIWETSSAMAASIGCPSTSIQRPSNVAKPGIPEEIHFPIFWK